MSAPKIILDRLADLSKECGVTLRVVKHWENESHPGLYCWFRGIVSDSRLVRIELAGTLAIELDPNRDDETDMFVFVNGVRVVPLDSPYKYLWRRGSDRFRWDDLDPGFETWTTLDHFNEIERERQSRAERDP